MSRIGQFLPMTTRYLCNLRQVQIISDQGKAWEELPLKYETWESFPGKTVWFKVLINFW